MPAAAGTKVVEVDPRGRVDEVRGIGERPRRIAEGVLSWRSCLTGLVPC
jgi:hypothetical protein